MRGCTSVDFGHEQSIYLYKYFFVKIRASTKIHVFLGRLTSHDSRIRSRVGFLMEKGLMPIEIEHGTRVQRPKSRGG